jgi:hypothetical protein
MSDQTYIRSTIALYVATIAMTVLALIARYGW